jgi:hypothetical protein
MSAPDTDLSFHENYMAQALAQARLAAAAGERCP